MARSSRPTADPAASYRAHATASRIAQAASVVDAARSHHDHAASAHETAHRILARVPVLQRGATTLRAIAETWRQGRRGMFPIRPDLGKAAHYEEQAEKLERSAAVAPNHAHRHHMRGLEHSATAREHEAHAMGGPEGQLPDETHIEAVRRRTVDLAAAQVAAANPAPTTVDTPAPMLEEIGTLGRRRGAAAQERE